MSLEIFLTEGPNVVGLSEDRVAFYVGYRVRKEDLAFFVIEGRKTGTPSSYNFHFGELGKPLEQAEITKFEYTQEKTVVYFELRGLPGNLDISNFSSKARYRHGTIDENVENVYNFFGDGKNDMRPSNWKEYFPDKY